MFGWIKERLGHKQQTCTCEQPATHDQLHCDICGYAIVERTRADIARMRGPV
jgi:hypothetical protein